MSAPSRSGPISFDDPRGISPRSPVYLPCISLQVRFLPTTEFTFEEHLVVSAAGTTLRATLQGRGVAPTLEVRGEQSEDGKTEKEVPVIETLTPNPNLNPHPNPN